jgi:hypothetical protein
MAAKKKRKISAAHLRALQAGRKRYLAGKGKAKRARKVRTPRVARKRKTHKARKRSTRVTVTVRNPTQWWKFSYRRGGRSYCAIGQGSRDAARARAQAFADKTGSRGNFCGPYSSRSAAVAACQ